MVGRLRRSAAMLVVGLATVSAAWAQDAARDDVRTLEPFNAIKLDSSLDVKLKAGTAERITLRGDPSAIAQVETSVSDHELRIGLRRESWTAFRPRVTAVVEFKQLESLRLRGSGDVHADTLTGKQFNLSIAGSGDVVIDALQVDTLAVSISGSGDVRVGSGSAAVQGYSIAGSGSVVADRVTGRLVAVKIAGSGDARVNATESLDVSIAGSGSVAYRGEPASLHKAVTGLGNITPLK